MSTTVELDWIAVASSNVASVAYAPQDEDGLLFVEFVHGGVYRYAGVPLGVFGRLLEAESVGGFLNAEVKPHYDCERVDD
jgi:hypothetical protein